MSNLTALDDSFILKTNQQAENNLIDEKAFKAPRQILEMYQKMSFPSFKIWACLLIDITEKQYTTDVTEMPISAIWRTLGQRFTHDKLLERVKELQGIVIQKDEYLPQTRERVTRSFQALGEAEIRSDQFDDVNMLQYSMMRGLMDVLKDETNEKFILEMKMIRSLSGDKAGNAAKNIILLCTPHINNGRTPDIDYVELKKFMGLESSYNNEDGSHNAKAFMRDVLKKATQTINENPYVNFTITAIVKVPQARNATGCYFKIEKKDHLELLPGVDPSSPLEPNTLLTILLNYWQQYIKDTSIFYEETVLKEILKRFQLVDKYIDLFISQSSYQHDKAKGTFELLSTSTAIFQLWVDGHFAKEDSKIYNYAITVFQKPIPDKINSIVKTFFEQNQISIEKQNSLQQQKKRNALLLNHAKRLANALRVYKKNRYETVLSAYSEDELAEKDSAFLHRAKVKGFGVWIQKGTADVDLSQGKLADILSRRTLDFYKEWLVNQAVEDRFIGDKSIDDFLLCFPEVQRDLTFLKITPRGMFAAFETLVADLLKQYKA